MQPPRLRQFLRLPISLLAVAAAVLVAAGVQLTSEEGWLKDWEASLQFRIFERRGTIPPSHPLVLVRPDATTLAHIGTWPLPARVLTHTITNLRHLGARTIMLDVRMPAPAASTEEWDDLLTACRQQPSVTISWVPDRTAPPRTTQPFSPPGGQPWGAEPNPQPATSPAEAADPAGELSLGVPDFPEGTDSLTDPVHPVTFQNGQLLPSLALVTAARFRGTPVQSLQEARGMRGSAAGLNWTGAAFPSVSLLQVLNGQVPPGQLRGALVIVSGQLPSQEAQFVTPFGPVSHDEMEANLTENYLTGRLLNWPGPHAAWWMLLGLSLVAALLGAYLRPQWCLLLALGGGLLMFAALTWLLDRWMLLLPLGPFLLGTVLSGAAGALLGVAQRQQTLMEADSAVAALGRSGALLASTSGRSESLGLIYQTVREAFRAEEVFLVLDATSSESTLQRAARLICETGRVTVWPQGWRRFSGASRTVLLIPHRAWGTRRSRHHPLAELDFYFSTIWSSLQSATAAPSGRWRQPAAMAAPLPWKENPLPGTTLARPRLGALFVFGRQQGGDFGQREAMLLQSLAREVALVLENLEFFERLQGQIDLANRDLREAYQTMTSQNAQLSAVMESMGDALIVADATGQVVFLNPAVTRLMGDAAPRKNEPLAGWLVRQQLTDWAALLPPGHWYVDTERLVRECSLHHDLEAATEAETHLFHLQFTLLCGPNREELGSMLLATDITVQRSIDRMKSDFVGYVAHELRTPLTNILGYASLLRHHSEHLSADQVEMTGSIMRHCRRLNRMISELLDVTRLEAGEELNLILQATDVVALARRVIADLQTGASHPSRIELQVTASQPSLVANLDSDRIEQVLINLVSNAIKYSPDGGLVEVYVSGDQEMVTIQVTDQGIGMTPEQTEHLFEKFYRTPQAKAAGIRGVGLGLFLVRKIILAHQGSLEVTSQLGVGSCFTVQLPLATTSLTPAVASRIRN